MNTRLSDNLFQGAVILVCTIIGAFLGFQTGDVLAAIFGGHDILPGTVCAVIGAFVGLVIGLLSSGLFLAVSGLLRRFFTKRD